MHANDTNSTNKLIYPELCYIVNGVCFEVHNELGRYAREKQYGDLLEKKLLAIGFPHKREFFVGDTGNIVDFLLDEKFILEIKAKRFITKEDYFQTQRYLQVLDLKLGLLVNFRDKYLKPIRIVKIETSGRNRFV